MYISHWSIGGLIGKASAYDHLKPIYIDHRKCLILIHLNKSIPIGLGRSTPSACPARANAKIGMMNLTYNICRCTQLKIVIGMG